MKSTSRLFAFLFCCFGLAFLHLSCSSDSDDENLDLLDLSGIDEEAAQAEDRPTTRLVARSNGNRRASYVRITPGSGGGVFGNAIRLYTDGSLVFARFMPFQEAIRTGNSHVTSTADSAANTREVADETTEEIEADPTTNLERGETFEKGNVKTIAVPNQLSGWRVRVYVDGSYIVTIYKDCNFCSIFNRELAIARAQQYLDLLQGWQK